MTPKRFMVIAGEASGDELAAELVRELRAAIGRRSTYSANVQPVEADLAPRFFGAGGPRMVEAGVELAFDLTQHSIIGIPGPRDCAKFFGLINQLIASLNTAKASLGGLSPSILGRRQTDEDVATTVAGSITVST